MGAVVTAIPPVGVPDAEVARGNRLSVTSPPRTQGAAEDSGTYLVLAVDWSSLGAPMGGVVGTVISSLSMMGVVVLWAAGRAVVLVLVLVLGLGVLVVVVVVVGWAEEYSSSS